MEWTVFYRDVYDLWLLAESPPVDVRVAVLTFVAWLAKGETAAKLCVAYPDRDDYYEAKVPGTQVFVEFMLIREHHFVDVQRIGAGSS